jgi:hypothetical protein
MRTLSVFAAILAWHWCSLATAGDAGERIETVIQNPGWAHGFHRAGATARVFSLTAVDDRLFAGGVFDAAGSTRANCLAAWDGSRWASFPGQSFGAVRQLAFHKKNLIVAGELYLPSDPNQYFILQQRGGSWEPLGSGVDGFVFSMAPFQGDLVVGGAFTRADVTFANGIACWTGTEWRTLGSGVRLGSGNGRVQALAVFRDKLIVGGAFTTAGGVACNNIASWDGSTWSPLGIGTNAEVLALVVHDDALIVGGTFGSAGLTDANAVAQWDGTSWTALGSGVGGLPYPLVYSLCSWRDQIIAGGIFKSADGADANSIASWNGRHWESLGLGVEHPPELPALPEVHALAVHQGDVYAGGWFRFAGGAIANQLARWDGSQWHPLEPGLGMDGNVIALTEHDGHIVAGGEFHHGGSTPARCVAAFDGLGWRALGAGFDKPVLALTVYRGNLVAGGRFAASGSTPISNVALWNGSAWSPLGSGLSGVVYAIEEYASALIAGGTFADSSGSTPNWIARWNGIAWEDLGAGLDGPVTCITEYENSLITGGLFENAGGALANGIAGWNGNVWRALGSGAAGPVFALAVYENALIAGGQFTSIGAVTATNIGQWDGREWTALGSGFDGRVEALHVHNGMLFAGGDFERSGATNTGHVAWWDGTTWQPVGPGTSNEVFALASGQGSLFVGGRFGRVGDILSSAIARWDSTRVSVTVHDIEIARTQTNVLLRWRLSSDATRAVRSVIVRRAETPTGPFDDITASPLLPSEGMEYLDRTAQVARDYWYLFVLTLHGGSSITAGPFHVRSVIPSSQTTLFIPVHTPLGTEMRYHIGRSRTHVQLQVFDVRGSLVSTLHEGHVEPGDYQLVWSGRDRSGVRVGRGVYLVSLRSDGVRLSHKFTLLN